MNPTAHIDKFAAKMIHHLPGSAYRWKPGTFDMQMFAATANATTEHEVVAMSYAAVVLATSGLPPGKRSLGGALKSTKMTAPEATERRLDDIVRAETSHDLFWALKAVAQHLKNHGTYAPNTAQLVHDIVRWHQSPDHKNTVLTQWATDYHHNTKTTITKD